MELRRSAMSSFFSSSTSSATYKVDASATCRPARMEMEKEAVRGEREELAATDLSLQ